MDKLKLKDISEIINDYDIFLFDLWGVVVEGATTYPSVVENINRIIEQKKVYFVTNAPRNIFSLSEMLKSWGLNVTSEAIISSGEVAVQMILESTERFNIAKPVVYHLGHTENDIINGIQCPITTNINEANILLLTLYQDESPYLDLNEFNDLFKTAIQRKTINICANPDLGINQHGIYRYCSGYYAEKLKQLGGEVIYSGKPYGEIYSKIFTQHADIAKNRIVMIGDTFYTDILGANQLGIDSALVLTGNAKKYHIDYDSLEDKLNHLKIAATEEGVMPSFIIKL